MAAIARVLLDMHDNESGDRECCNGRDELSSTSLTAAMPIAFRFANPQVLHGLTQFGNVILFAQHRGQQIRAHALV